MLLLPAVPRQGLPEVPVPVEQPDTDERNPQVTGRLQMIAGQDAEAAGVLGQRGRDPELGREVGDGGGQFGGLLLVPAVPAHIGLQLLGGRTQPAQEVLVLGKLGQPRGRHAPEQLNRVARPPPGVDRLEELTGLRMP